MNAPTDTRSDTRPGRRRALLAAMAGGIAAPRLALGQSAAAFPQQPVKLVIAYPPGGGGDGVGRPLAQGIERHLGGPVILDYHPGAGGTIAAQRVASQPADGYTIYLADNGAISVAPAYRKLAYGPRDFTYLAGIGELPLVLVTNPKVAAKDLRELAELSRTRPNGLSYASGGVGSIPHLTAELARLETRMKAEHVAYKGSAPATTDLIAGVVDWAFFAPPGVAQHVASGRLVALAVTSNQRLAVMPSVPTVAELGFPSLQAGYMSGVLAPRNLPAPVAARLSQAVQAAMADPEVLKGLEASGLTAAYRPGPQAQERYEKDMERWRTLIQTAGLKLE